MSATETSSPDQVNQQADESDATQQTSTLTATQISQMATSISYFLDGNTHYLGAIIKRIRQNAFAVRAALIDVIVHTHFPDHRGKPRQRGKCFYKAYEDYAVMDDAAIEQIPPAIQRWLTSDATWHEIDTTLAREAAEHPQSSPWQQRPKQQNNTNRSNQHSAYQQQSQPGQADQTNQTAQSYQVSSALINETQAQQLAERIQQDGQTHGYSIETEIVPQGGIFVIRISWDTRPITQQPMLMMITSAAQWQQRFTDTHASIQEELQAQATGDKIE